MKIMKKKTFSIVMGPITGLVLLSALEFSGVIGGCSTATSKLTRNVTGTLKQSSLPKLSLAALGLKGSTKDATIGCSDITVAFTSYNGKSTTAKLDANCNYTVPDLTLNTSCFGGFFTGADKDGNGVPDTEIASLGCAKNGSKSAIPIYANKGGGTDDINFGTVTIEGKKGIASTDPCSQVDTDGDGTTDDKDSDADGNKIADTQESTFKGATKDLDDLDTDKDGLPDCFEKIYEDAFAAQIADFFKDANSDGIPDKCEAGTGETSIACSSEDKNCDGIPDASDEHELDADGDGVPADIDCDDADKTVTFSCYSEDACAIDQDGDGVNVCEDCNDTDASNTNKIDPILGCQEKTSQQVTCASDSKFCTDGDHFSCQTFFSDTHPKTSVDHFMCVNNCCEIVGIDSSGKCSSDVDCKNVVGASAGTSAEAVENTTCLKATGICQVNCSKFSTSDDVATCVSTSTTNGSTCDSSTKLCTFSLPTQ